MQGVKERAILPLNLLARVRFHIITRIRALIYNSLMAKTTASQTAGSSFLQRLRSHFNQTIMQTMHFP